MPTTKQGHLRERSTQDVLVPKTIDTLVKDSARNQALSASLQVLIEQNALGFTPFVTIDNYAIGDVVFYDRKLWTFTSAHTAGAWTGNDVAEFSIKDYINVFKTYVDDNYAKKDGEYDLLIAGRSKNFVGEPIPVTTGYTLKATGYDPSQPELEFADGIVNMTEIQGRACAWNQLCGQLSFRSTYATETTSGNKNILTLIASGYGVRWAWVDNKVTTIQGHKYLIKCNAKVTGGILARYRFNTNYASPAKREDGTFIPIIATCTSAEEVNSGGVAIMNGDIGDTATIISNYLYEYIDLTILNPTLAAKADLTVAEVEAYIASIRTPKPYYTANLGQLLGARMMGWQLRKTANLLNPTTKQAKLFEYVYEPNSNKYTVNGLPSDAAVKFVEDRVGELPARTNIVTPVASTTEKGLTITNDGNNKITISGTANETGNISLTNTFQSVSQHKYLVRLPINTTGLNVSCTHHGYWTWSTSVSYTITANGSGDEKLGIVVNSGTQYNGEVIIQLYDLTAIFGEGNEPATVAAAELALFGIVTPDANRHFVIPSQGVASVINAGSLLPYEGDLTRTSIIATWDGSKDGEIVAYEEDSIQIDSANIYLDSAGTQQAFTDGILKGAPSVADRLYFDEVSKKWVADIKVDSRAYTSGDESDATVITDKTNTWYALTTPETHTNLYYKVGNNEYVPMEEVFPNGIQGLCCNWASENLVEQAEDAQGQPQSITPVTTEVFQSDYKELLKTIGDTYVSKEQEKDNFDNFLSALNTNSATALGGTYATDGFNDDCSIKFTFTPTT